MLSLHMCKKNQINCALFDQHDDAILPYLDEPREEPLIVVLQHFKAIRWNDEELVKQYLPDDFMSQQTGTVTEMDGSNSPEQSQAVVNLHIDVDDHDSLAAGEDSVSTKTQAKRPNKEIKSGPDGSYERDVDGRLTTNKFSRRGGKKGKL